MARCAWRTVERDKGGTGLELPADLNPGFPHVQVVVCLAADLNDAAKVAITGINILALPASVERPIGNLPADSRWRRGQNCKRAQQKKSLHGCSLKVESWFDR